MVRSSCRQILVRKKQGRTSSPSPSSHSLQQRSSSSAQLKDLLVDLIEVGVHVGKVATGVQGEAPSLEVHRRAEARANVTTGAAEASWTRPEKLLLLLLLLEALPVEGTLTAVRSTLARVVRQNVFAAGHVITEDGALTVVHGRWWW